MYTVLVVINMTLPKTQVAQALIIPAEEEMKCSFSMSAGHRDFFKSVPNLI